MKALNQKSRNFTRKQMAAERWFDDLHRYMAKNGVVMQWHHISYAMVAFAEGKDAEGMATTLADAECDAANGCSYADTVARQPGISGELPPELARLIAEHMAQLS